MNIQYTIRALLLATSLSALAACGGGSSNALIAGEQDPPPVDGIGRNGIAIGPVANFGSVIVNGVTYNTDAAVFTVNDEPGTQSDLRVGDVVIVTGKIDDNGTSGTAETVTFDDLVKGPVQSVDLAANSLLVLGQKVIVSPDTSFDDGFSPASLDGISVGQLVEVSGQFNASGDIIATRIEPKPVGTQFEVHGIVSALDTANGRFSLGALVVDYSTATLDDFASGQPSDGDFVEAKGLTLNASDELVATKVELESFNLTTNNGDHIEVEGFITRFVTATDFDVAGIAVTTTAGTVFEGGVAADLGLNIKVEVEGDVNANGQINATKVDIRRAKAVRTAALVDAVDANANSLVVLGITVTLDALTRIEDKTDADVDPLRLSDINVGDYLEIRGDEFPAASGAILATILEREDVDGETVLQGFVETVSEPSYTVLGVTIETNSGTVFRDEAEMMISAAEFFSRVAAGALVKAEGVETSATVITASEVEFENE